ncbi:hypothetical protein KRX57_06950 [Weeksellaceae bacterium TAE3-ERU29]|nr:hypothetical protein [Weeksellaceae bacterium TAE3-ERU29]
MTKFSQIVKKYIVDSQIWVSICFVGLSAFYQVITQSVDYKLLVLFFFATLSVYNLSYYAWSCKKNKLIIAVLSIIPVIFISLYLNIYSILLLTGLSLLSVPYAIPIKNKKLREFPYLKIYIISFVWSASIVFLPILNADKDINYTYILYFIIFFLYVMAITIPFDVRDYLRDSSKMKTIPQIIGVEKSLRLSKLCFITLCLLSILISPIKVVLVFFMIGVLLMYMLNEHLIKKSYYCSIYIEGLSLLPLLLYIIMFLKFNYK